MTTVPNDTSRPDEALIELLLPGSEYDYSTVPEGHAVLMWEYDPETNTFKPNVTIPQEEFDALMTEFMENNPWPPEEYEHS